MMDLKDTVIRTSQLEVISGKKWGGTRAVEDAESRVRLKEVIGAVQQDR